MGQRAVTDHDDDDENVSRFLKDHCHFYQGSPCKRLDLNVESGGKLERSNLVL